MKDLSEQAESLKQAILQDFDDWGDAELAILQTGLEAYDLLHECQAVVETDGLTVQGDRGGVKAHPLLSTIRDSRAQFLMALKHLKLDAGAMQQKSPGRPTAYDRARAGKGW